MKYQQHHRRRLRQQRHHQPNRRKRSFLPRGSFSSCFVPLIATILTSNNIHVAVDGFTQQRSITSSPLKSHTFNIQRQQKNFYSQQQNHDRHPYQLQHHIIISRRVRVRRLYLSSFKERLIQH